jgi:predicted phage terminase large subunit-like protein
VDMEGSLADRAWFSIVDAAPADCKWVRAWDFAATVKSARSDDPDYLAGVKLGAAAGVYYIGHVVHQRSGPGDVEAVVKQTAQTDGPGVPIIMEQEPGSAGKLFTSALIRNLAGWPVQAQPATGDKATRAMPWLAQAQVGNVKLVRGGWNGDFLDEVAAFPVGAHDDMVDAVSGAFNGLTSTKHAGTWGSR